MNSKEKEKPPILNIERNPLILLVSGVLTIVLMYLTYITIFNKEVYDVKPYGFFLLVPTSFVSFQTLWYLLNPFALFYEDKLEIKYSLFHNKFIHYVDIKIVNEPEKSRLGICYNDNEKAYLNLFGIKPNHKILLKEELFKQIQLSLAKRALIVS